MSLKESIITGIGLAVENAAHADSGPVSKKAATPVFFPKSRRCEVIPSKILSQI